MNAGSLVKMGGNWFEPDFTPILSGHRRSAQTALLALPVLCAMMAGCAGGPPKEPGPLAGFARSPAFEQVKNTHAEAATDRDQRTLLTTWFVDGDPNVAEFCSVLPDGHVTMYRYVYDSAWHGGNKQDLGRQELSELKQTLDALPPSQTPLLRNLLIVSFRDYASGQWVTRTYDRTFRPAAVSALFAITGAPIDPAPDSR